MKTGPEIASERSGMPVGVDVPETGQRLASGKISRLKPVSLFASTFASVQANQTCRHALRARKHRCTLANIARCNGLKSEGMS